MAAGTQILVVDDDQEMVTLLRDFLSRHGYKVSTANSGKNALSFFEPNDSGGMPELVLSDVKMSPVNGLELTIQLKVDRPNVPIILFSAYANGGLAEAAVQAGAKKFLRKPFGLMQILGMIREVMGKAVKEEEH